MIGEYTRRSPDLVPVANVQLLTRTSVLPSFVMAFSVVVYLVNVFGAQGD
jgi:hypothetical protein